jgi:hypothetical protein
MDLDLKDLGATLVTGAYFFVGLSFLIWMLFRWDFRFFFDFAQRISGAALTMLTLCIVFVAGMLFEDLSNWLVDTPLVLSKVPYTDFQLLPQDREVRAKTLFGEEFLEFFSEQQNKSSKGLTLGNLSPGTATPSPTPAPTPPEPDELSLRAAELDLFAKHVRTTGPFVQETVLNKRPPQEPRITRQKLIDAATQLYYRAKNTAYTVTNHYDELKQIQTRIDFSRSFALLSLLLALTTVCFGVVALTAPLIGPVIAKLFRRNFDQASPIDERRRIALTTALRMLSLVVILAIFFVLGRFAYLSEEKEFDKRAYGYFLSLSENQAAPPVLLPAKGYSGLVRIDESTFLVVHDTKDKSKEPRLGTLTVQRGSSPLYFPVEVDWGPEPPNDLEGVCSVPNRMNEFLVIESGDERKFARIFHIVLSKGLSRLSRWTISDKQIIPLSERTVNLEGLACVADKTGRLILLLGERGGSKENPTGKIRWGTLDLISRSFESSGEKKLTVPSSIDLGQRETRACADLYVDAEHRIWSVATQDQGNDGPFRSVIYQAGTINPDASDPIQLFPRTDAAWTLDGVKVEGLATSPIEGSPMSIATDDENYEGIWRPLFPTSVDNASGE